MAEPGAVDHGVREGSRDERFVRQVLKKNPNLELLSLFILRTHANPPEGGAPLEAL
jgi:hypothetical protein